MIGLLLLDANRSLDEKVLCAERDEADMASHADLLKAISGGGHPEISQGALDERTGQAETGPTLPERVDDHGALKALWPWALQIPALERHVVPRLSGPIGAIEQHVDVINDGVPEVVPEVAVAKRPVGGQAPLQRGRHKQRNHQQEGVPQHRQAFRSPEGGAPASGCRRAHSASDARQRPAACWRQRQSLRHQLEQYLLPAAGVPSV
mmetsp:Transcript_62692/g.180338  ORF Transcript_62692/g.180338 Transcript_62692/m.180338 type:complete len:207 (+) Transcript_62692:1771-2391(+)